MDVLANDTDTDGGPKSVDSVTQPANGTVVITGGGTGLTYVPSTHYCNDPPGTTLDTFTYTLTPGGSKATVSITVTCVNDPPVFSDLESAALAYIEGDGAVPVTSQLVVDDVDNTTLSSATVQITTGYQQGQDVLAYSAPGGVTIVGAFDAPTGILTLSGVATLADYQAALRAVTYTDTSDTPSTSTRTVSFQGDDGGSSANLSTVVTRQITVSEVNDAPVNTVPGAQTVDEDTNLVFSTTNSNALSIADADAGSATVQVDLTVNNGILTFPSVVGLTFVDGTANGQASIHVTGSISAINTALDGLIYRGASNFNSTRGTESLAVVTKDNGNSGGAPASDTDTVAISVTAVNDAPTALPKNYTAQTNMQINLRGLISGATDPDDGDNNGTFASTYSIASLTPVNCTGCTIANISSTNNGSFDFDPPPGGTGTFTLEYTLTDTGNPGAGTSAPATITIAVSGPVIWFVDPAAAANGNGRLSSPFKFLAGEPGTMDDAVDVDEDYHRIFLYSGTASSGLTLNVGEWLVGQATTGTSFDAVMGISPPIGTIARPAVGTGTTSLPGKLRLASDSIVKGIAVVTTGATLGVEGSGVSTTVSQSSISTEQGIALDLTNVSGTLDFSSVSAGSSTASPMIGIRLTNVGASITITDGTIQNTNVVGITVDGSNGTFSYAGDVSNTSGRTIVVQNRTGGTTTFSGAITGVGTGLLVQNNSSGTVTFSGASKSLNTGANAAVTLASNTGTTITFSGGGLAIVTTTGIGFNATGGATAINVSGTNNSITAAGGTALNVVNTTIGVSGLVFRSIVANGGTSGIVLNSTGADGGLTVQGTGTADSGGTIQNMTGDGVSLVSTRAVNLNRMLITNNGNNGVYGDELTDFSIADSSVTNNDSANTVAFAAGIRFDELYGSSVINNTTVSGTKGDNLRLQMATGTLTNLAISGSTFGPNPVGTGANGVAVVTEGSANVTVTIARTTIAGNQASGLLTSIGNGTQANIAITDSTLTDNNIGIDLGSSGSGQQRITVSSNTLLRHATSAINIIGDGVITGTVGGNIIGNGSPGSGARDYYGIAVSHRSNLDWRLAITNNTIRNTDFEGIFIRSGDISTNTGSLDLTLTGNTVAVPDDNSGFPASPRGIAVRSRQATTMCANIANNESQGANGGVGYRLQQSDTSSLKLQGFTTDAATTLTNNTNTTSGGGPTLSTAGEPFAGGCTAVLP